MSTEPMAIGELMENALLDVLGLLEPHEHRAFERAFAAAPPAVQAQVRREQTRLSRMDFLLPDVDPPTELRAMVLDAVRRAMLEDALRSEGMPAPMASRSVSRLWRTTSLAFATAAVVLALTTIHLRGMFDQLNTDMQERTTVNAPLSPAMKDIVVNPSYAKVSFTLAPGAPADLRAQAALHYSRSDGEGFVYCQGLPADPSRQFQVVQIDEAGKPIAVPPLVSRVPNTGSDVEKLMPVKVQAGSRLAIAEVISTTGELRVLLVASVL